MTGTRTPGQISRQPARLRRAGFEILQTEVDEIDVPHRRVKTTKTEMAFDRLVIALGAELAPDALPGFADEATTSTRWMGRRPPARR
jgi:sulfide:quinone oxidoreductase